MDLEPRDLGWIFLVVALMATIALRRPLAAPMLLLAAAFSRVYVGVHYQLDVIGGAAFGAAVAIALRRLAEVRLRSRPPQTPG